jgi:amidase
VYARAPMSIASAYDAHDALGLAELVRAGEVTENELLEEAIRRAQEIDPKLNAIVIDMFDEARRSIALGLPDGPLRGVPFLLKDLVSAYAGVPLRGGSKLYEHHVPKEHGELVKRYLAAGVVVFGKTNTSEWGILPTVEPALYGACHNPWKRGYTAGGSSGGAAAVVAARIVPVAHGGDAGGSIRIPASCCGVFGLKPTRGRNPMGPDGSERAHGLGAEHVCSISVRDSAAFLDASAGPEITAPYWAPPKTSAYLDDVKQPPGKLRIAYTHMPLLPGNEDPDCRRSIEDAVSLLTDLGHECVEAAPPVDGAKVSQAFFTTYCAGVAGELKFAEGYLGRPAHPDDVEPTTWLMGMIGRTSFSAGDFSLAIRQLQAMSRDVHRFMEGFDCYLTPTAGKPPVAHGSLGPQGREKTLQELAARLNLTPALKLPGLLDKAIARAFAFAPFTPVSNVTGQPSMSVPLFWNDEGLPMGVCFTSRFGDEPTLFRLAAQLEAARPWRDKKPPICAS